MKAPILPFSLVLFFLSGFLAFAEYRVSPYGVLDSGDDGQTKISYNVQTENGVVTETKTVPTRSVSTKQGLEKLAKELGNTKFVLSPEDTPSFTTQREFTSYSKPEPKATAAQFRTRLFYCAKDLIITETRKFYKNEVPKAVAPLGSFLNASGGSMVLTDKNKRPLGTLIIAYETEFVEPTKEQCEKSEFFVVSQIPSSWKKSPKHDVSGWNAYRLPSGELVLAKNVKALIRCIGYRTKTTVTFTFNKLEK